MVLQILPDARQMMRHGDAVLCQCGAVADAGEHQQMRCLERAGRKDHFATGAQPAKLLALPIFDTYGALAFEQDAGGMRRGFDPQIGARSHVWMDISPRGAPAFAVFLRDLVDAEAFLLLGIEILADPELGLARRLQKNLLHRIVRAQSVDRERTALAVIFAVEVGIVFRALEVGEHVEIRPAAVAERRPAVIVAPVAADIDHGVDRARSAETLAARLVADAAVEARLRYRLQRPV